jgi:hypothetical protein
MLLIESAYGPVLFRNAYCGALVFPTAIAGKTSGFGSRLAVDAGIPVPLNPTVCGAPDALLLIVSVAKNTSVPVGGAKVTLTPQTPPAVIVPSQVFVAAKAVGLVPLNGVVNVRFVFPMFCKTTNCALLVVPAVCLPKLRNFGVTVASVALAFSPVPIKKTACGEVPVSLSATVSSPSAAPAAVGVYVTLIVQLKPGPSDPGQVLAEIAKVPLGNKEVIVGLMPVNETVLDKLVSVAVMAPAVVPTTVLGNCSNVGVKLAICAVPVPLAITFAGVPVKVPEI